MIEEGLTILVALAAVSSAVALVAWGGPLAWPAIEAAASTYGPIVGQAVFAII